MTFLATALLVFAFMCPVWGHARTEYVFVLLLLAAAFLGNRLGRVRWIGVEVALLYCMLLSTSISIIVYYSSNPGFHWRDTMSLLRLPVYSMVLLAPLTVDMTASTRRGLGVALIAIAAVCAAISLIQYFNVGGVNLFFLELYRGTVEGYLDQFVYAEKSRRVIGTAGNPNLWGFVLSCFAILTLARVTLGRGLRFLPLLVALVLALTLTGSRSAVLSFVVGSLATVGASVVFMRRRLTGLAIGVAATLFLPILGVMAAESLGSKRFESGNLSSLYARFYVWQATLREYQDDLLLGRGPTKSLRRRGFGTDASKFHVRDNNYIATLTESGVIGLGLLIALFLAQFRHLWRLAPKVPIEELHWVLAGIGIVVSWIVFNFSADAFNNVYLAHTQWILYGLILAIGHQSASEAQASQPARREVATDPPRWGNAVYGESSAAPDGRP